MNYSTLIEHYLNESGVSADDFAKMAGVHRSTVFRARHGNDVSTRSLRRMMSEAGYDIVFIRTSAATLAIPATPPSDPTDAA